MTFAWDNVIRQVANDEIKNKLDFTENLFRMNLNEKHINHCMDQLRQVKMTLGAFPKLKNDTTPPSPFVKQWLAEEKELTSTIIRLQRVQMIRRLRFTDRILKDAFKLYSLKPYTPTEILALHCYLDTKNSEFEYGPEMMQFNIHALQYKQISAQRDFITASAFKKARANAKANSK